MASNTRNALLALLKLIDSRLKSDVVVVSYGGTALTLLKTKESSEDIDFIIPSKEEVYEEFFKIYVKTVKELRLAPGDYPPDKTFEASMLQINDCLEQAQPFKEIKLKHITLLTMNPIDILLTKYHRGLPKDLKDIRAYLMKRPLSRQALWARYVTILQQQTESDVRRGFAEKYERFIKDFGSLLK